MPRKPAVTPNKSLHTTLPASLAARLDLFLWSEVEGRIPRSAYQDFISARINEFFDLRSLDIGPMIGVDFPCIIKGSAITLHQLTQHLKGGRDGTQG